MKFNVGLKSSATVIKSFWLSGLFKDSSKKVMFTLNLIRDPSVDLFGLVIHEYWSDKQRNSVKIPEICML